MTYDDLDSKPDPLFWLYADNYRVYSLKAAKALGILTAIYLAEIAQKYKYLKEEGKLHSDPVNGGGWFSYTADICEKRTGLTQQEQRTCYTKLVNLGLIEQINIGIPRKKYFRLNSETIFKYCFSLLPATNKLVASNKQACCQQQTGQGKNGGVYIQEEQQDKQQEEQQSSSTPPASKPQPSKPKPQKPEPKPRVVADAPLASLGEEDSDFSARAKTNQKAGKSASPPRPLRLEVADLGQKILKLLVDARPDYIPPQNTSKFLAEVDYMLRLDGRPPDKILVILKWALTDSFWRAMLFKPNPASILRKHYITLDEKMKASPNRPYVAEEEPDLTKDLDPHLAAELKQRFNNLKKRQKA